MSMRKRQVINILMFAVLLAACSAPAVQGNPASTAMETQQAFDADTGKDMGREIREYFIPDFSNWKDHDAYKVAFDRLLRDLNLEEKVS